VFDTWGYAIKAYDNVRLNDPRGPLADDAVMATGNAHFLRGHWEDADYYYTLLRTEYPKSDHQIQAHLLSLQCKLRKYQGPDYDGKPLREAEQLIDRLLVQFSHELGQERERLLTAKAEVRAQLALRDWDRAQYYDQGQYYAAARRHYQHIVDEFPQTALAQQARQRLEQIAPLPDVPPDRFELITQFFDPAKREEIAARRAGDTTRQ
jgi:outer membrane protein assembly factor BamD (BamD/ComL family)